MSASDKGPIDRLINGIVGLLRRNRERTERLFNQDDQDQAELEAQTQRADRLVETAFGGLFDELEDDVVNELTEADQLDESNVERLVDQAEGAAVEDAAAALAAIVGVELTGAGQIESHEELTVQVLSFLALENVLGLRSQVAAEDGAVPPLRRQIHRETTSKIVDLADAVEEELREKNADQGFLSPKPEYGLPEEEVRRLEKTAIRKLEPEELLEEPIQYGVVPSEEVISAELDRAGISEPAKDLFLEIRAAAPRSADMWEQRTTTEELVRELDRQVAEGEKTVDEAMDLLPEEVSDVRPALRERFELLRESARSAPNDSDVLDAFSSGLIRTDTAVQELQSPGKTDLEVARAIAQETLEEADGDLQRALAYGLITEAEYDKRLADAGVPESARRRLAAGASTSDIVQSILQDQAQAAAQGPGILTDIGEQRSAALRRAGFETVDAVAQADPQEIAEVAGISVETAEQVVSQAEAIVEAGP